MCYQSLSHGKKPYESTLIFFTLVLPEFPVITNKVMPCFLISGVFVPLKACQNQLLCYRSYITRHKGVTLLVNLYKLSEIITYCLLLIKSRWQKSRPSQRSCRRRVTERSNSDPICISRSNWCNCLWCLSPKQVLLLPYQNWIQSAAPQHKRRKHFSHYLDSWNAHFIEY